MMFDGHEHLFFFQTTNQSRRRTDSLGKSNKGQNFGQNINERHAKTSDVHVAKMKVVFVTGSLTILTLKLFNSPMF